MRHRSGEHGIVLLDRHALFFFAQGRRAILERYDVIAFLVPGPNGRFHAAIGQETAESDGRNSPAPENEIKVRRGEPAETAFAFDDDIAGLWLQDIHDLRTPSSLAERLAVHNALEDAVRVRTQLMIVVGERDRRVHNRGA